MSKEIVITFSVSELQIQKIKQFCADKLDNTQYVISVQQTISDDLELGISIFQNRPTLYIGIFSKREHTIVKDITIPDDLLTEALAQLDLRYHHAMTKNPPTVNKELAWMWLDYFNSSSEDIVITI